MVMKNIKNIILSLIVLSIIVLASSYTNKSSVFEKNETVHTGETEKHQTVNMFVTHGHCSTPFSGIVENLKVDVSARTDQGNPLENMKISFDIDPNSFQSCASDDLTARVKTPGLFITGFNDTITFRTTNVYTMGLDWYQVNGKMSIKGVEKEVKFFATGIREPNETHTKLLVLEGQLNLFDWGIDYDKIVTGNSDAIPTKWLHINMKVEVL